MRPGGARAVVAESLLVKHQMVILNRGRERAPNLRPMARVFAGLCTLFIRPGRLLRIAVILKPSTLLAFHAWLVKPKYRQLFSPKRRGKPGPKEPSPELIAAIVETRRRNPSWGCCRIAQQLCFVFGLEIDKDVVRRVLAKHYRPDPGSYGPSWLTVLGHTRDSLWSIDLFRCESLILKSHWVLVVMDQYTRQIIGFGIQSGESILTLCPFGLLATCRASFLALRTSTTTSGAITRWMVTHPVKELGRYDQKLQI